MNELYSEEVGGVEVVGVMFNSRNGEFYEFQDPETHDDYERLVCPRTGDVISFEGKVNRMMGEAMSGHTRLSLPAEEYEGFREEYIGMEEPDYEVLRDRIIDIATADPREDIEAEEIIQEVEG